LFDPGGDHSREDSLCDRGLLSRRLGLDCELTLKDLHAIQKSFTTILLGIFHHRIEYPERMENGGIDKRFPKNVRSGQAAGEKTNRGLINLFEPGE
jgi:hypothetical protein